MKKILITILISFTLISTACSAASTGNKSTANTSLSTENKLIIGTIKLEGTAQAVTAEQANKLLPLWQLRKELSTNSATAPQETEAVIKQIESTMTTEQMQAINDMKLTPQDAMTVLQEQGTVQSSKQTGNNSQSQNNGGGFGPPAGGLGGGPGGEIPGMGPSVSTSSTTTTKTTQSQSASNSNAASSSMIDLMIQYLQKKAGA